MILTKAIEAEANKYLGCKEVSSNYSLCVNEIKELFQPGSGENRDAWCAKFVYSMTNEACKKLNVNNPLKRTASTVAMITEARKNLRVDTEPSKGAIFFYSRGSGYGHVGFVLGVGNNDFTTIEGNTESPEKGEPDGVFSKTRALSSQKFEFIHLEDLDTLENNINSLLAPLDMNLSESKLWVTLGAIVVAGFGVIMLRNRNLK